MIFSAGFGTRMGGLGKILPKPAWPLFETTLLGAQIEFALSLGCQKIFVNTHHLHEKLKKSLHDKYLSNVVFVFEKEILGSGGGIHNIFAQNLFETDKVLTLNSDAFFFIPQMEEFEKIFDQLSDARCLLMGARVSGRGAYREMAVAGGYLTGFNDFAKESNFVTYSGMGLINLEGLVPFEGQSNFFESVANFKDEPVRVVSVSKSEFWDFGTKEHYKENIYKLIAMANNDKDTFFVDFMLEKGLMDPGKVGMDSYNASRSGEVNFTSSGAFSKENAIMIETGEDSQVYCI